MRNSTCYANGIVVDECMKSTELEIVIENYCRLLGGIYSSIENLEKKSLKLYNSGLKEGEDCFKDNKVSNSGYSIIQTLNDLNCRLEGYVNRLSEIDNSFQKLI